MKTSIFPDDWKKAKVTPIFKAGDRSEVGNYRPISILPIVSKIMERAVHDQLYVYISKHDLLSDALGSSFLLHRLWRATSLSR